MWVQITIDYFKYTQLPCKTRRDSQRDLQSQIQDNLGFKKMEKNEQTNKQNSGTLPRTNLTVQTTQNIWLCMLYFSNSD